MTEYYKIARPDGWDFKTGETINYRDNIGKRVVDPQYQKGARCCNAGVLHASKDPLDALRWSKLPCSVYRVSGRPVDVRDDKAGFKSFRIIEEIPESEFNELFGFDYMRVVYPINPLEIDNEVTDVDIENLKEWISVGASAWDSVGNSVWASVWASVGNSVGGSVGVSVWDSVGASAASVWDSVGNFVGNSVTAYIGSCFPGITDWKYMDHEPGEYPFQCGVDLWERGFIPLYLDGKWHLWKENGGIVYTLDHRPINREE